MKKLAIITSHPIQYNAPFFTLLAGRKIIEVMVFYTWGDKVLENKYDPGFRQEIKWDINLLNGYNYNFVKNTSSTPGSDHFTGIKNPSLIRDIQLYKPDAIMVYGWSFNSHLKILRHFHGKIPILFRGDSTLINEQQGIKKILRRIALGWIYRHVDYALYAGEANKKYFEVHGIKERQLRFMPHAIDNKRFGNSEILTDFREQYAIDSSEKIFLFSGKLDRRKRPGFLAEVFANLSLANATLIFVGTGELLPALKENYAYNKKIIFTGFINQSQMPGIYSAADVLVLPSESETWGLCINEAMAAGKAIIASDSCGATPNLVHDGVNGFSYETKSDLQLGRAISALALNESLSRKMGLASLNKISSYSYEACCEVVEETVNNLS